MFYHFPEITHILESCYPWNTGYYLPGPGAPCFTGCQNTGHIRFMGG